MTAGQPCEETCPEITGSRRPSSLAGGRVGRRRRSTPKLPGRGERCRVGEADRERSGGEHAPSGANPQPPAALKRERE